MKSFFFLSLLLLGCSFGFSNSSSLSLTECPAPANLSVVAQTSSSVSFDWDDCGCALTEYRTFWMQAGQASSVYATFNSSYVYNGLSAGTYQFYFYTVCGEKVSSIIIDEVVVN